MLVDELSDLERVEAHETANEPIVLPTARHLKWRALDPLEYALMCICGLCLLGFTVSEIGDVVFRVLGHPWLTAQEFSTGFFIWGAFLGGGIAVRRDTHFRISAIQEKMTGVKRAVGETLKRLVILAVGVVLIYQGYLNYLTGFGSFLVPSGTPIAVLYAALPVFGALVVLFEIEQLVNGWRNGFEVPGEPKDMAHLIAAEALEHMGS
jgi:TRAP-type C4-dicarboxylate transport system permease small subunit